MKASCSKIECMESSSSQEDVRESSVLVVEKKRERGEESAGGRGYKYLCSLEGSAALAVVNLNAG